MNIFYFFPETSSYMLQWQRIHIFDELERNGHTIKIFNPLSFRSIDEANETLPKTLRREAGSIDLFMNAAPEKFLYRETMKEVQKIGIPSLLICFDNLHAPFIHREMAPYFDLVWLTSKETQSLFEKWHCNTLFQPYAANPYTLAPNHTREIGSIGFIGRLYDDRVNRVNRLITNNIPCTLYSDGFFDQDTKSEQKALTYRETARLLLRLSQFGIGRKVAYGTLINKLFPQKHQLIRNQYLELKPSVDFAQMGEIYSNHALALGISELRNTFVLKHPVHKLHLRTFEIPMCGGLQIAPFTEELAGYFEDGKEIVLCKNDEEFIDKATFYLKPDNERLRLEMKQNARKRAEAEHTWNLRFNKAFQTLGIK
ncbi:MAG: glycosyltransferase family protein [Microbacter sp.]